MAVTADVRGAARWDGATEDYITYSRLSGYFLSSSTIEVNVRIRNEVPYALVNVSGEWRWIVSYTASDLAKVVCEKKLNPSQVEGNETDYTKFLSFLFFLLNMFTPNF